tara:strand:+ start:755 stop:1444 length:690 start_codon:yes stop_codon:yes gene_type:complete
MKKAIRTNSRKIQESVGEYNFSGLKVFVKDPLPKDVDTSGVFRKFVLNIPAHFITNVDAVYVGQFDFLKKRDLNAMFRDGAIFLTNIQDSDSDMLDDLFHETAHAVEDKYSAAIYQDAAIENEFLGKRQKLYHVLEHQGYDVTQVNFLDVEYSINFDEFLYKQVGYATLATTTMGLFYSPYGATSLREYFATGFEAYYYNKDLPYLKKISPKLYEKLFLLEKIDEDRNF